MKKRNKFKMFSEIAGKTQELYAQLSEPAASDVDKKLYSNLSTLLFYRLKLKFTNNLYNMKDEE